jgi:hypothetical protein
VWKVTGKSCRPKNCECKNENQEHSQWALPQRPPQDSNLAWDFQETAADDCSAHHPMNGEVTAENGFQKMMTMGDTDGVSVDSPL